MATVAIGWREERWLSAYVGISAIMISAALTTAWTIGAPTPQVFSTYTILSALILASWLVGRMLWQFARDREAEPLARLKREWAETDMMEWGLRLLPYLLVPLWASSFSILKSQLPNFNDFAFDVPLASAERQVLGTDAWRLTHGLFGNDATPLIDAVYNSWLLVLQVVPLAVVMFASPRKRAEFFLSFVLCWALLGILLAGLLLSGGPCFYEDLGHGDDFAPLMVELNEHSLVSLRSQALLWSLYSGSIVSAGVGISAMPSLHVAIATLYLCVANGLWRWLAAVYAVVIYIGSIHIGWHYAADGIVGALGAWLIWGTVRRSIGSGTSPACALTAPLGSQP